MLIDTHAHLYWESFKEDFVAVIQRAIQAGVTTVINVGVDVEKSKIALNQVKEQLAKFEGFKAYSTIGIHPHEALKYGTHVSIRKDIVELEKLYQSKPDHPFDSAQGKIVAVGECGLDFFFQNNPGYIPPSLTVNQVKDLQRQLFQAQIDLAKKLNLPLIVHCRDDRSKEVGGGSSTSSPPAKTSSSSAWDEVLEMVGTHPAILHCYSGLDQTTQKVLPSPNLLVSFAGNLTYPKNEYLREAVKILPLDRICLETDSPFLAPQSKRGQRNEPASVKEIAELVAEIKGISLEKVAEQTTKNVKQLLKID